MSEPRRPGVNIWPRQRIPLDPTHPRSWRLRRSSVHLRPTVPDSRAAIADALRRSARWRRGAGGPRPRAWSASGEHSIVAALAGAPVLYRKKFYSEETVIHRGVRPRSGGRGGVRRAGERAGTGERRNASRIRSRRPDHPERGTGARQHLGGIPARVQPECDRPEHRVPAGLLRLCLHGVAPVHTGPLDGQPSGRHARHRQGGAAAGRPRDERRPRYRRRRRSRDDLRALDERRPQPPRRLRADPAADDAPRAVLPRVAVQGVPVQQHHR